MNQLSSQEVFDIASRHMLTQLGWSTKWKEERGERLGAYRGDGGRKCPIGVLIPDELYNPRMEDYGTDVLLRDFGHLHDLFDPSEDWERMLKLLYDLQCAHEYSYILGHINGLPKFDMRNPDNWRRYLRQVAKDNNLDASVLDAPKGA